MSSGLMDIEPGGESTQYESIKTVTEPHAKVQGQFRDNRDEMTEAESQQAQEKKARGEKTAENVRYGEAISEHGMGGETLTSGGVAGEQGTFDLSGLIGIQPGWDSDVLTCWRLVRIAGFGRKKVADGDVDAEQSRKVQGYGPGSGVGA